MDARRKSELVARGGAIGMTMLAAFGAAILLLLAFSSSFGDALGLFFLGPFKNLYYFGNMLNAAVALTIAGLAACVAFASKNFNLGGEGQVYAGAIAAVFVCISMPEGSPVLVPILAAAAAMATGGLLGWFSGFLKRSLSVDELISSFLVSSAVVFIGDFLVTGPLQDPASNFQTTQTISAGFRFEKLLPPSSLSTGCIVAPAAVAALWFLLTRTRFGFELRTTGRNGEFAKYCGIDTGFYASASMALSGALYGFAGAALILGTYFKVMKGFSAGIGWSGLAVALVAGNNPLAVLPAALFFAYVDAGAKAVMVGADVSSEIVGVVQSVVFFLVTARAFDELFLRRGRKLAAVGPSGAPKGGPSGRGDQP
jgi:riboflavin transport system permease protein